MSWVSPAEQQVIDVAKEIVEAAKSGGSIQDILTRVGWTAATFGRHVANLLTNPALQRAFTVATREMLRNAVRLAGAEAVEAAVAAGLTMTAFSFWTLAAILGGIIVVGGLVYGGYVYVQGEKPILPGVRMTGENCPEQTRSARKCPWTPEGYTVGECTPGFCWDGGPQGTLACKQENQKVPNAHLNDLNNLVCNDGFTSQVRDPCTGVLLRCE